MKTPSRLPLPHSGLGVASFIISLTVLASFIFTFIVIMSVGFGHIILLIIALIMIAIIWFFTLGNFYPTLEDMGLKINFLEPWMQWVLIIQALLLVIAFGLSMTGMMQHKTKKIGFAVLGGLFSIIGIFPVIVLISDFSK